MCPFEYLQICLLINTGDDTYVKVWRPAGGDDAISSRLSRSTFAHSAKSYPRQAPSCPHRQAVISSNGGSFREVSDAELDRITTRLNTKVSSCRSKRHGGHVEPVKSNYTPRHPSGRVTQQRVDAITDRLYTRHAERDEGVSRSLESYTKPQSARQSKSKSAATRRATYYNDSDSDSVISNTKSDVTQESQGQGNRSVYDSDSHQSVTPTKTLFRRSSVSDGNDKQSVKTLSERPDSGMSERSTTSTVKQDDYPRSRSHSVSSEEENRGRKHTDSDNSGYSRQDSGSVSSQKVNRSPKNKKKIKRSRSARSPTAKRYSSYDESSSDEESLIGTHRRYRNRKEKSDADPVKEDQEADVEIDEYPNKQNDDNTSERSGQMRGLNNNKEKESRASSIVSVNDVSKRPCSSQSKISTDSCSTVTSRKSQTRRATDASNGNVSHVKNARPSSSASQTSQKSFVSAKSDIKNGNSRQTSAKNDRSNVFYNRRTSSSSKASDISNKYVSGSSSKNERNMSVSSAYSSKSHVINDIDRPSSKASVNSSRSDMINVNSRASSAASRRSINSNKLNTGNGSMSSLKKDTQNRRNGTNTEDRKYSSSSVSSLQYKGSGKSCPTVNNNTRRQPVTNVSASQSSLQSEASVRSSSSSVKMAKMQAKEARAGLLKVLLDEDKKKHGGSLSSLHTDNQSEVDNEEHHSDDQSESGNVVNNSDEHSEKQSVGRQSRTSESDRTSSDDSDSGESTPRASYGNTKDKPGSGNVQVTNMDKYNGN